MVSLPTQCLRRYKRIDFPVPLVQPRRQCKPSDIGGIFNPHPMLNPNSLAEYGGNGCGVLAQRGGL